MSDDEKIPVSGGLFELLSQEERQLFVEAGGLVDVPANEVLFNFGDPGGCLYIVHSGLIEIFIKDNAGQKISLKTIDEGGFFGETSLFDGRARSATAIALADCKLLKLDRENLITVFREHPESAIGMLAALGGMLRNADKLLQTSISRNVNDMMENKMSPVERLTDWIAWFSGSILFLVITAIWFGTWIAVNTLPLGLPVFDPFPFGLLTMIVSLEAIFLSCFVLISQNRQAEKDHLRSDIEYDVNIKAEMEIAHLHEKVDRMNEAMLKKFELLENSSAG